MKRASLFLAAALLGLWVAPATAQPARTFVSGQGSDANPCALAAPCRSFQHAHDSTSPGGEVVALDAAGYGPLTISKAITITAIGIEASITTNASSPTAITISAGASDAVSIRGLTLISGFNSGTFTDDGIDVAAAKSVAIRDCTISGFSGRGIRINPSANLDVELRTVWSDNNGVNGLRIDPSGAGHVTALVDDSHFGENGSQGVYISGAQSTGAINATLSVASSANVTDGIFVTTGTGKAQPVVMITGSKIVNNGGSGLFGDFNVLVFVDRTQITGNAVDGWIAANGASVNSYKDNEVNGNGTDGLNGVVQISSE